MKRIGCILLAVLLLGLTVSFASGDEGFSVTYRMPNGQPDSRLTDADVMTRLTVYQSQKIELQLSNAGEGRTLYLEWFSLPANAAVEQYGAGGERLSVSTFQMPDRYAEEIPVDAACTRIVLAPSGSDCVVSTLFVSEEAPSPERGWLFETPEACDILIIAPTPADVMETFGPTLAKYAIGHGVTVGIVCMTVDYRYRLEELDRALVKLGIDKAPIVFGIDDGNYLESTEIRKRWTPEASQEKLRTLIDRLRPKLVLTIDQTGDNLRESQTYEIVTAAIGENSCVKKLYVASGSGTTIIDCTERMPALGGWSAYKAAREAYRVMDSRGMYRVALAEKPSYRLVWQTVGTDQRGDDLLENISHGSLMHYNVSNPVQTEAPATAVPDVRETSEPSKGLAIIEEEIEIPTETEAPIANPTMEPAPKEQKKGLFSCGSSNESQASVEIDETPAPTTAATEAPTAEPTPEPTEAPTPEPTAEPTPEPTPEPVFAFEKTNFDEHFLEEGEPEFVSFDDEKGEWIYRSEILAVEINRVETTMPDKASSRPKPVVYFVAHIYERGYDSFRPTFGSWRHNGLERASAEEMARTAKAVVWITGDNLIHMDKEKKGTLIRDGYLFQKSTRIDSCWLNPKTHTIEIVAKNAMKAEDLWESGVENCFSFGPVLLENGEIAKEAQAQRRDNNPRTMIGMVEPGHLIAVVVVGRQDKYSIGVNCNECAQIMKELGCTVSYNLDGGQSAAMIFLGVKLNQDSEGRYNGLSAKNRTMPDGLSWGYSELCGKYDRQPETDG